jgi:hypothetical protein
VGDVQGDHGTMSNVFGIYDNNALMLGISSNGILVNGTINFFAGGSIFGDRKAPYAGWVICPAKSATTGKAGGLSM